MHRYGHVGAALAAYAPVAFTTAALGRSDLTLVGAAAVVSLAMLPDVDLRLPLVPHRGPTHTVWFALVVAAAGGAVGWIAGVPTGLAGGAGLAAFGTAVAGAAIGSHLVADAMTPMGIRPYAPLSDRRITHDVTAAANPIANALGLVLGVSLVSGAFLLGTWIDGL